MFGDDHVLDAYERELHDAEDRPPRPVGMASGWSRWRSGSARSCSRVEIFANRPFCRLT